MGSYDDDMERAPAVMDAIVMEKALAVMDAIVMLQSDFCCDFEVLSPFSKKGRRVVGSKAGYPS